MASRFFAEGNISDDDSDSSDEQNQKVSNTNKKKFGMQEQVHGLTGGRKLIPEMEKKKLKFKKMSRNLTVSINIKDYDKMWENLQQMLAEVKKSEKFIEKEGYPNSFLRVLKNLSEEVKSVNSETLKKMKNANSFKILKQKLKKILPEYQKALQNFVDQQTEESSESSPSLVTSEESQSEIYKSYFHSDDPMIRRKYWLKRTKKQEKEQKNSQNEEAEKKHSKAQNEEKKKYEFKQVQKREELRIANAKDAESKIKGILKEFAKLPSQQKREEYLENLDIIVKESKKYRDFERLSILLIDIPIRLEVNRQMKVTHFPRSSWLKLFEHVKDIFIILRESQDEDLLGKIAKFEEDRDEAQLGMTEKQIYGMLKIFIVNLDRQLHKSFDFLESNEVEYSDRLQDLIILIDFMYKISRELIFKDKKVGVEKFAAEICFKVLENMYFMSTSFMEKINESNQDLTFTELANEDMLDELGKMVLSLEESEFSTKTLLYIIYNHAVNRRDKAKDILFMTNIAERINSKDYYTQACFNRAMVQLGISAFHQGNIYETQQILSQICGMGKREQNKQFIKEYLAQPPRNDRDISRHRILPYYLHFNIDLIEAIELISSMILQTPYTLTQGSRISSKTFKRLFNDYQRSHFIAQPLKYRDLVYAASKQLKMGNWRACLEYLQEIKIWNELQNAQEARDNLKINIKQAALKCYILANRKCFRCVSLVNLAQKFQLDLKTVRKLVCKWINQKDRDFNATITEDDYLNLADKKKDRQSGINKLCQKLFVKLEDISVIHEQVYRQKLGTIAPQEEEEEEGAEPRVVRKVNQAMTDKLKNILSRRTA